MQVGGALGQGAPPALAPVFSSQAAAASSARWRPSALRRPEREVGGPCGMTSFLALGAAAGAAAGLAAARLRGRTQMAVKYRKIRYKTCKGLKRVFGPRKLKSGYWQQGNDDDDIDIFEWIAAEDFVEAPAASPSAPRVVAAWTENEEGEWTPYDPPEYRPVRKQIHLSKGARPIPPPDQGEGRDFVADISKAVKSFGDEAYSYEGVDVITSLDGLRMLLSFLDGQLTEDMRAKGLNTRRGSEPALIDLMRISRMPEAPEAICLGTVWNWVQANATNNRGPLNSMGYSFGYAKKVIGRRPVAGAYFNRQTAEATHYRMLEMDLAGVRMLVRVPVMATLSAADADDLEGHAVSVVGAVHRKDAGSLWSGEKLPGRYAQMLLSDSAMTVRGIVDRHVLIEEQEVTRADLELDRPNLRQDTELLLGKLAALLRVVKDVAGCKGCIKRLLYLQYSDAELRIISPHFDVEGKEDEGGAEREVNLTDERIAEMLFGATAANVFR